MSIINDNTEKEMLALYSSGMKNYEEEITEQQLNYLKNVSEMRSIALIKQTNEYVCLHVNKKPKWIPKFMYYWIMKKLLNLTYFKT